MTLLDAPKFDTARDRRRRIIIYVTVAVLAVIVGGFWLAAGMPFDWPWTWNSHRVGTIEVDRFLHAVEKNDLKEAYGIWNHDREWQQHLAAYSANPYNRFLADHGYGKPESLDKNQTEKAAAEYGKLVHDTDWKLHQENLSGYTFDRFQQDWGPNSPDNDYGTIQSHVLKMAHVYGNVLVVGILINGRKSKALFLDFDRKTHVLGYSPVEYYLGP